MEYYDDTSLNRKLPAPVKEKWLTALRSGDYKQAKSALRKLRSDKVIGYCCLGVLTDIYIQDTLALHPNADVCAKPKWSDEPDGDKLYPFTDDHGVTREAMPTGKVNVWANRGADGWIVYVDEKDAKKFFPGKRTVNSVDLASLNDSGRSFKTIADIIEKYL